MEAKTNVRVFPKKDDFTVETNVRVFPQKDKLYVWVREAKITGAHISSEIAEKACLRYVFDRGLPAIVHPGDYTRLLVATLKEIKTIKLESSEWTVTVSDVGKKAYQIKMRDKDGAKIIPSLVERALICSLQKTKLWTVDGSRIWYEPAPFDQVGDIEAYRRYHIGALPLDEEGVGVVADIETAFFTIKNLAYYLDRSVSTDEQKRRRERMTHLMKRQEKQKGTLVYDNGRRIMKCYFANAPNLKCSETPEIRINDKTYKNLVDYYRKEVPELEFDEGGEAVQVSFAQKGTPVYVAAELLRIRVMNDNVHDQLNSADKIQPQLRRQMLLNFWEMLGDYPFGRIAPKLQPGFWQPLPERLYQFKFPHLVFGQGIKLKSPTEFSVDAFRDNYKNRIEYLDELGCWYVPPNIQRTLYIVYPQNFDIKAVSHLVSQLENQLLQWTKKKITFANPIPYSSVLDATSKLKEKTESGMVVFILDSTPSAYYEAAFQLDGWRIKRITEYQLGKHYSYLEEGMWDRKLNRKSKRRGRNRWLDFVNFNTFEILQSLGTFPFVPEYLGEYEAQLFIDVGHERRDFILNLLIARSEDKKPMFTLTSRLVPKDDPQKEGINSLVLADEIEKLFTKAIKRHHHPLASLLVQRDGRFIKGEIEGVNDGLERVKAKGLLTSDAIVDYVDLRKSSQIPVRMWAVKSDDSAINPLEGTAVKLNKKTLAIASTGEATLPKLGTARPYMVVGNGHCTDIVRAGEITFTSTQINWSNPQKGQRLPFHVKDADEVLQNTAAQRIRRYR